MCVVLIESLQKVYKKFKKSLQKLQQQNKFRICSSKNKKIHTLSPS
uniref:Uncharacterized protein n=1 Tax=viral metagenome TaxID=1070528 RepID=A0A6C0H7M2_9ZZZZ